MRITAQILSVLFHPLLMLTYMLMLLLLVNPYLFGVNNLGDMKSMKLIIGVFVTSFLLPGFAIFLMWRLQLISSLEMRDKQDRIIPFIASGIFYLWIFRSVIEDANMPTAFIISVLGTTMGLFICFLINLKFKISLHAVGMGGLVGMVLIMMWLYSYGSFGLKLPLLGPAEISMTLLLMVSIIIAGVIGTVRLFLKAHTPIEVYAGFAVGVLCQFIALKILV
jgi:hypothetical protein